MGQPAYSVLEEFLTEDDTPRTPVLDLKLRQVEQRAASNAQELRLQEAYSRGFADGENAIRHLMEARIAELSATQEREIAGIKSQFSSSVVERLTMQLEAGLENARSSLANQIAGILEPVLAGAILGRTIEQLVAEVSEILDRDEALVVEVKGPQPLLSEVMCGLAARQSEAAALTQRVRVTPAPVAEVTVECGDTVIETRLAAWLAKIEGVRAR